MNKLRNNQQQQKLKMKCLKKECERREMMKKEAKQDREIDGDMLFIRIKLIIDFKITYCFQL